MGSVRSWVVGVARSVVCGYLYPKMVGLWGRAAGVRIIDTRRGARAVLVGALVLVARCFRGVGRPLVTVGSGGTFQLYCNGVQWVTFKFNLKF